MVGSRNKHTVYSTKLIFFVMQRENRKKLITQKFSAVDVRIKQILFDNCCIAPNTLIIITTGFNKEFNNIKITKKK